MSELIDFSSTSSGLTGVTRMSAWLGCPAKARAAEQEEIARNGVPWELFSEEDKKPVATLVGSLTGEMVQRYHRGVPVAPSATFSWNGVSIEESHPASVKEARRLVDAYTQKRAADCWGEIVACEFPIRIPAELFGFEITGSVDILTRTNGKLVVRDVKTDAREDSNLRTKYSSSPQLWLYSIGVELALNEPVEACAIHSIIKTKDVKLVDFDFEAVTERRMKWLQNIAERVKEAKANPRPEPHINHCNAWGRDCGFLVDSLCSLL